MGVTNTYKVGKTQWAKWNDNGRTAFNEAREAGATYADAASAAVVATNEAYEARHAKKRGILDVVEGVLNVATKIAPVVTVAKTLAKKVK